MCRPSGSSYSRRLPLNQPAQASRSSDESVNRVCPLVTIRAQSAKLMTSDLRGASLVSMLTTSSSAVYHTQTLDIYEFQPKNFYIDGIQPMSAHTWRREIGVGRTSEGQKQVVLKGLTSTFRLERKFTYYTEDERPSDCLIPCVAVNSVRESLYIGNHMKDARIREFCYHTGKLMATYDIPQKSGSDEPIILLETSNQMGMAAVCQGHLDTSDPFTISIWKTGDVLMKFKNPMWSRCMAFSSDDKYLCAGFSDASVGLREINTSETIATIKAPATDGKNNSQFNCANSVHFCPARPDNIVIGYRSGRIRIIDTRNPDSGDSMWSTGVDAVLNSVTFDTTGNLLLSSSRDSTLRLFDIRKAGMSGLDVVQKYTGHINEVFYLPAMFWNGSRNILVGSEGNHGHIYDTSSGDLVSTIGSARPCHQICVTSEKSSIPRMFLMCVREATVEMLSPRLDNTHVDEPVVVDALENTGDLIYDPTTGASLLNRWMECEALRLMVRNRDEVFVMLRSDDLNEDEELRRRKWLFHLFKNTLEVDMHTLYRCYTEYVHQQSGIGTQFRMEKGELLFAARRLVYRQSLREQDLTEMMEAAENEENPIPQWHAFTSSKSHWSVTSFGYVFRGCQGAGDRTWPRDPMINIWSGLLPGRYRGVTNTYGLATDKIVSTTEPS